MNKSEKEKYLKDQQEEYFKHLDNTKIYRGVYRDTRSIDDRGCQGVSPSWEGLRNSDEFIRIQPSHSHYELIDSRINVLERKMSKLMILTWFSWICSGFSMSMFIYYVLNIFGK